MSGHAESTKVGKIADGKVCFTDRECINVGAGTGRLAEGPFAGASEWIVEVRDAKGTDKALIVTAVLIGARESA